MSNFTETPYWEPTVDRLDTTDPVQGGPGGKSNEGMQQVVNRLAWAKQSIDNLKTGAGLDDGAVSTVKLADNAVTRAKVAPGVIPSAIRNTVLSGPVDADGLPTAVTKTGASTYRINGATKAIIVTFAAGFDEKGQVDFVGRITSDTDVTVNDDAGAPGYVEYIFVERNTSNGNLSFGRTIYAPSYSYIAPTSPSSGQLWIDLSDITVKRWNGSAWLTVQVVIMGEFQHTDFNVTTLTCYEYRSPIEVFSAVPAGTIIQSASSVVPTGYLKANGQAVSRSIFARLFRAIGTTYGAGNGSTTFNVPDLRGEFIRGWDDGRNIDTHTFTITGSTTNSSATVTASDTSQLAVGMSLSGTGIPAGAKVLSITSATVFVMTENATATGNPTITASVRQFGSYQADLFKSHFHIMKKYNQNAGSGTGFFAMDDNGTDGSENTESTGGSETRPRNRALAMYIKT